MKKLTALVDRLNEVRSNATESTRQALETDDVRAQLIDLNLGQLKRGLASGGDTTIGVTPKGTRIAGYRPYAALTVQIKSVKGWPFGAVGEVTLYDEGDFYAGWFIEYLVNGLFFGSHDKKAKTLGAKYGRQIYGLDGESLQVGRQAMRPYLFLIFKRQLKKA